MMYANQLLARDMPRQRNICSDGSIPSGATWDGTCGEGPHEVRWFLAEEGMET
jgi:hypothetical protein